MKTLMQQSKFYRAVQGISLLALLGFLSSCVDLDSQYAVNGIENGKSYVGLQGDTNIPAGVSKPTMPEKIIITYDSKPSTLPVYLNGFPISDKFTLGANSAEMDVSAIDDLLKQGGNTLMVNPLAFGPSVRFSFDNDGPMIDVVDVEDIGGAINVSVRTVDSVSVDSVTAQAINYEWNGDVDLSTGFDVSKYTDIGSPVAFNKQADNNWQTSSQLNASNMYKVTAIDAYGYTTENYYLSPTEKINDVFKLRMNKEVLDNAVPLVVPQIEGMHIYSKKAMDDYGRSYPTDPEAVESKILDSMGEWWKSSAIFYNDVGASASNVNACGYVDSNVPLTSNDFTCTNIKTDKLTGARYCLKSNLSPNANRSDAKQGRCSRIVLWRLQLDSVSRDGQGKADMSFTLSESGNGMLDFNINLIRNNLPKALYTDMGIRNIQCENRYSTAKFCTERTNDIFGLRCGFVDNQYEDGVSVDASGKPVQSLTMSAYARDGAGNAFCRDAGAVTYLGANLGAMEITADGANPNGPVKALIENGALDLQLDGMKLNLDGTAIGGSMSSFYSWAIGLVEGLLDSMFVGIVENTLQQNLQEFILGFDLFTEWDSQNPPEPSMQMQSQAYQTYTNADNNAATKLEWFMQYAGFLKNVKQHPDVPSILGSRYTTKAVLDPVDSGSVLDMAINVNIINQALASMYLSGVTHITVTSLSADGGKALAHFGPSISDTYPAISGDKRVELVPRTPGVFEMKEGTNGTQASLYYRNAQMNIQTYNGTDWKNDFVVEVDMRIGVIMTTLNDRFQLKVLGTPELVINTIRIKDSPNYIYNETSGSSSTNINIGADLVKGAVQFAVNLVLNVAIPQVAEQVAELEFPGIAIPETPDGMYMSSKTLKANNGEHLEFGFGMEIRPCTVDTPEQTTCNP